jgi:hypothetical protein
MKALGVISTTALFLLLGVTVPAFAQEEGHDQDAKPAQQDEKAKPAKPEEKAAPAKQEDQAKTAKQEDAKPAKPEEKAAPAKQEEQAKTEKQDQPAKPVKEEKPAAPAKQTEQAKSEKQAPETKQVTQEGNAKPTGQQHAQRTAAEVQRQHAMPALHLSARGSGRIPDAQFSANFGQQHTFVINEPVMVGGYSRFQYGGFWFGFVQPWPAEWYYTDDVFVVFTDGGYYLCNPYYPGALVSISVVI